MTFQIDKLISTASIVLEEEYLPTPSAFFQAFDAPWENVKGQILKLETRQIYRETGNASYEAMMNGDMALARKLLPLTRKEDDQLYEALRTKKVEFIRCRPVIKPISKYLEWELECYKLNEKQGEKVFFLEHNESFDKEALHDFMIFDRSTAMVHDYDDEGEIRGGWVIKKTEKIDALLKIFSKIKASSVHYSMFEL